MIPDQTGAQHADEMANVYARNTAELVLDFRWRDVFRPAAWRAIRESAARYWQWTEAGRMAREGQRNPFNPRAW